MASTDMQANEKKKRSSWLDKAKRKWDQKLDQLSQKDTNGGYVPAAQNRGSPPGGRPNQQPRRPALPSYAETVPRNPKEGVPPSEPRECRQLLREMYAMNVWIKNCTFAFEANKPLVKEKEERAAAALTDLRRRVEGWLELEGEWNEKEMKVIWEIYELVKQMQPVPVEFHLDNQNVGQNDEEMPSDRNETASTVDSYYDQ
jgi:hypothetical protein